MNDIRLQKRLYNPNPTATNHDANNAITKHHTNIVVHNRDAGIHSLVISDPTNVQSTVVDEKSIVISIHGAKFEDGGLAYGIWFAEDSRLNSSFKIPPSCKPKEEVATLLAALKALWQVETACRSQAILRLILKTDSELLAYGISSKVWRWAETQFCNSRGRKVALWRLWEKLHESISDFENKQGVEVKFWLVKKEHNEEAERLAHTGREALPKVLKSAVVSHPAENEPIDCYNYWVGIARTIPAARGLALELGLDFPGPYTRGIKLGLLYPIRRLVVTGFDREENFHLLFGPTWNNEVVGVKGMWQEARIQLLSCPPPHTEAHKLAALLDTGTTRWTPRGPDKKEEETLLVRKEELAGKLGTYLRIVS